MLDTPLIRLQCYEGIDAAEALYEWNYPRQLLSIRLADASGEKLREEDLFGPDYLIRRPLLRALEHPGPRPAVLLIDEIDRADDDFEAFLLELLAEASVTIPELGTIRATHPPIIVLTSNRTRDLHDAVKRRCLYHWIDYPTPEREVEIVRRRVKGASQTLAVAGRRRGLADARLRRAEAARHRRGDRLARGARACSAIERLDAGGDRPHARLGAQVRRGPGGRSARPASRSSCAAVTDAPPSASRRSSSTCRRWPARSAGACTTPACRSRPAALTDFARALALVAPDHAAGGCTGRRAPCSSPTQAQVAAFDRVFRAVFGERRPTRASTSTRSRPSPSPRRPTTSRGPSIGP